MRLFMIIFSIVLLTISPCICEFFYPDDINNWWQLRLNIYSVIFYCLFIINTFPVVDKLEKYFKFTTYVGVGLTSSDVIDRWLLNINWFTWTDFIMVMVVLTIAYRKYLCQQTKLKF